MSTFITITGQKHYFGILPFSVGTILELVPETDNLYDKYAIAVISSIYGKVGSVAQTPAMLAIGTMPAASVITQIPNGGKAIVRFIAGDYIIAEVC